MISFELQTDQKKPSTVARPLDPNDFALWICNHFCGDTISQFIFSGGRRSWQFLK
jgi:hypothetical protein